MKDTTPMDEYQVVPIDQIAPHPDNPRRGDVEVIKASIQANGFRGALVVQRSTGYILAGNHRWRAAQALGFIEVPVVWADVDDETAKRILLADNRTSDLGDYDIPELAKLLASLPSTDGTGYSASDLDELLAGVTIDPDPDPEPGASHHPDAGKVLSVLDVGLGEPVHKVVAGQTWTFGRHVLVVADLMRHHHLWAHHLQGDVLFMPYPGPYLVLSDRVFPDHCDQMVVVSGIDFHSMCEHHMLGFAGTATVAYIPDGQVVGLSKLARLVEVYARRLQVQERLTEQIAEAIDTHVTNKGVGVVIRAHHSCMGCRGVRKPNAHMTTSSLRGLLKDSPEARAEFLHLAHSNT